ncbi:esterase/lipase family protein [Acinetobacter baumannii]|uniref:esterase/lipase family protein n=1 Tax=Acinetobacter baumannii TaxID=470 RepID=UPI002449946A|nr:hypothetical protein [Acinetobacter baumannii]MDH2518592.1 hypothetical protein [Acinetobacter baumannii]
MEKKKKAAVVFIHGLAKKPKPEKLQEIWLWGLERNEPKPEIFGNINPGINLQDQGIPLFFSYWADVFYGTDYETDYSDQYEATNDIIINIDDCNKVIGELQLPQPTTPREVRFLSELQLKFNSQILIKKNIKLDSQPSKALNATIPGQLEIASWLPKEVKEFVIRKAAIEAYYYLFNKDYKRSDGVSFEVRKEIRNRFLSDLKRANEIAEKIVIVSHSMGTMIAYDVLRNVEECPFVDSLITLGSPLGIKEIQDELRSSEVKLVDFPSAKLMNWINVYDPLDPICGVDPKLANEYLSDNKLKIKDIKESNWGSWRHTATHYLAGVQFRRALAESLGVKL